MPSTWKPGSELLKICFQMLKTNTAATKGFGTPDNMYFYQGRSKARGNLEQTE